MSSDGGRSRCSRSLGRRGRVGRGRARSKSCGPRLRPATPMPASVGSSSLRVTAHSTGRDPFEMKHTHFFLVSPNGRGRAGLKEGGREGGREGARDPPAPAPGLGANVYPWTTAADTDTNTDVDLPLDRERPRDDGRTDRPTKEREGGRPSLSGA